MKKVMKGVIKRINMPGLFQYNEMKSIPKDKESYKTKEKKKLMWILKCGQMTG